MSDNKRRAIAYLNLVLVEEDLWPDDKRLIERVIQILQRNGR